jgi:hypothetical protein
MAESFHFSHGKSDYPWIFFFFYRGRGEKVEINNILSQPSHYYFWENIIKIQLAGTYFFLSI